MSRMYYTHWSFVVQSFHESTSKKKHTRTPHILGDTLNRFIIHVT
jgi:hypothetical protein